MALEHGLELLDPAAAAALRGDPLAVTLDVREPWECALAALSGSIFMPLGALPQRWTELDTAAPTLVVCHHGVRSLHACLFLRQRGFSRVSNLDGGIDRWAREIDPSMARY
jgi:rhodanese-related sulfurtransferase